MQEIQTSMLFDFSHTVAAEYLANFSHPWEALPGLSAFILSKGATLSSEEYDNPIPGVWIAKSATVAPSASIGAPCIICENAEIRQCAYIRGSAIVGAGAVVGNSCELKNCILFDSVQVPHFNYVGDSILGYKSHMGAGAITSNVKSDKTNVVVRAGEERIATGMRKFGAMLGDFVEVGCNCVLNPGTIIGRHCSVYPLTSVRGVIPEGHIVKSMDNIVLRKIRKEDN